MRQVQLHQPQALAITDDFYRSYRPPGMIRQVYHQLV